MGAVFQGSFHFFQVAASSYACWHQGNLHFVQGWYAHLRCPPPTVNLNSNCQAHYFKEALRCQLVWATRHTAVVKFITYDTRHRPRRMAVATRQVSST